jgi:hypothetical protein
METGNIRNYFPKKQRRELKDGYWGVFSVGVIVFTIVFILNHQQKLMILGMADDTHKLNIYKERVSQAVFDKLNTKYSFLSKLNAEVNNKNVELMAKVENYKINHKLFVLHEKENLKLNGHINKIEQKNHELETHLSRAKAKIVTYREKLFQSKRKNNVLQAEYDTEMKEAYSKHMALTTNVKALTKDKTILSNVILSLKEDIVRKDSFSQALKSSKSLLQAEHKKFSIRNKNLERQVSSLSQSKLLLTGQLANLKTQLQALNSKVSVLKLTEKNLQGQNSDLVEKNTQLVQTNNDQKDNSVNYHKVFSVLDELPTHVESRNIATLPDEQPVEKIEIKVEVTNLDQSSEQLVILTKTDHIVQSGEDLMVISKRYYNTHQKWRLIRDANPSVNTMLMNVGDTIVIPNVEMEEVVWINGKMRAAHLQQEDSHFPEERRPANNVESPIETSPQSDQKVDPTPDTSMENEFYQPKTEGSSQ